MSLNWRGDELEFGLGRIDDLPPDSDSDNEGGSNSNSIADAPTLSTASLIVTEKVRPLSQSLIDIGNETILETDNEPNDTNFLLSAENDLHAAGYDDDNNFSTGSLISDYAGNLDKELNLMDVELPPSSDTTIDSRISRTSSVKSKAIPIEQFIKKGVIIKSKPKIDDDLIIGKQGDELSCAMDFELPPSSNTKIDSRISRTSSIKGKAMSIEKKVSFMKPSSTKPPSTNPSYVKPSLKEEHFEDEDEEKSKKRKFPIPRTHKRMSFVTASKIDDDFINNLLKEHKHDSKISIDTEKDDDSEQDIEIEKQRIKASFFIVIFMYVAVVTASILCILYLHDHYELSSDTAYVTNVFELIGTRRYRRSFID